MQYLTAYRNKHTSGVRPVVRADKVAVHYSRPEMNQLMKSMLLGSMVM